MNTEKYLEGYFQELKVIEERMNKIYAKLEESVTDQEFKSTFKQLKQQEKEHRSKLEDMKESLQQDKPY